MEEINEQFNKELQQQIDGTLPVNHTYKFGNAGVILQAAGLPDLPIELRASRLSDKSMQENHPFDLSEIKDLPKAIQHPLAVFRSATHLGSYVVLTEIQHQGKNFVVAIETNRQFGRIEVNTIRSIYPKNNTAIVEWINDGLMEYADRQKLTSWINKQRSNSADVANPTRNSTTLSQQRSNSAEVRKAFNVAAKIIQNFKNPIIFSP